MRWIVTVSILLFGIITLNINNPKYFVLGLFLYSLPALFQFSHLKIIRYWAIWGGVFLVAQSILTPLVFDSDFHSLPPGMNQIVFIKGGFPGISGKQLITTDSKGFRTTKNIDYRSNSTYRIFAIGGSTTEQLALGDEKTWTHLLQKKLNKNTSGNIEVINTGLSGLRAKNHLATLKQILPYHPDMVLFLVGINDWNWHIKNRKKDSSNLTLHKLRQELLFEKTMLGKALHILKEVLFKDKEQSNVSENYGEYYTEQRGSLNREVKYAFKPVNVHGQYKHYLEEINSLCKEYKIKCVFMTQPTGYHQSAALSYKDGFWMTPPNAYGKHDANYTLTFDSMIHVARLYNNYLVSFANDSNHQICDLASEIGPSYDYFYDDCHFNTNGAVKAADLINSCVSNILH